MHLVIGQFDQLDELSSFEIPKSNQTIWESKVILGAKRPTKVAF